MRDYEVGYGRPPMHSRLKKGVCPNPNGRRGSAKVKTAEIVKRVLNEPIAIQEKGRVRKYLQMAGGRSTALLAGVARRPTRGVRFAQVAQQSRTAQQRHRHQDHRRVARWS